MITIYFEPHARSVDNEAGIASGHYDVELSEAGCMEAAEGMPARYDGINLDVVFTSDLRRAHETAQIMFENVDVPLIRDPRLRECDYGDLTRRPFSEVDAFRRRSPAQPFPNGESYEQAAQRIRAFLDDLKRDHDGKTVLVIGHPATHFGLERWIDGVPVETYFTSWPVKRKYRL